MNAPSTTPQYKREFPDFGDMDVEIPEGFVDTSWHNDACPSFWSGELGLSLYVDYAAAPMRDGGGEKKRFVLLQSDGDDKSDDKVLVETDSYEEVAALIKERSAAMGPKLG